MEPGHLDKERLGASGAAGVNVDLESFREYGNVFSHLKRIINFVGHL